MNGFNSFLINNQKSIKLSSKTSNNVFEIKQTEKQTVKNEVTSFQTTFNKKIQEHKDDKTNQQSKEGKVENKNDIDQKLNKKTEKQTVKNEEINKTSNNTKKENIEKKTEKLLLSNEINIKKDKTEKVNDKQTTPLKDNTLDAIQDIIQLVEQQIQHTQSNEKKNTLKSLKTELLSILKTYLSQGNEKNSNKSKFENNSQHINMDSKKVISLLESVGKQNDIPEILKKNISKLIESLHKDTTIKFNSTKFNSTSENQKENNLNINFDKNINQKEKYSPINNTSNNNRSFKEENSNKNYQDSSLQIESSKKTDPHSTLYEKSNVFSKEIINSMSKNSQTIDHKAIISRLSHQIKQTHILGKNKMIMQLFPENLGKVTVHLDKKGDHTFSVKMIVDSSVVKDVLDNKIHELKNQLNDSNLSFTDIDVNLKNNQQKQNNDSKEKSTFNELDQDFKNEKGDDLSDVNTLDLTENNNFIRKNLNGLLDLIA